MTGARWPLVALALAAHAAWLLVPVAALGRVRAAWADPATGAFLLGATFLAFGDLAQSLGRTDRSGASGRGLDPGVGRLAAAEGGALLVVFWTALAEHALRGGGNVAAGFLPGLVLMAAGASLRLAAIRALGRFFVTEIRVLPDQPLVRRGVYRLLRHPSETGLLAAAVGACLLLASPLALVLCPGLLLPLAALRARREDGLLAMAFGEAHRRYAREVGGLLPRPARRGSR